MRHAPIRAADMLVTNSAFVWHHPALDARDEEMRLLRVTDVS